MPGLGLSPKIFEHFLFEKFDVVWMEWIEPSKNETFDHYIDRLIDQFIEVDDRVPFLLGHSLGGIVVQEIAKKIKVQKLILVSSVESDLEFPNKLRLLSKLRLERFFHKAWLERTFVIWRNFHDYKSTDKQKLFYHSIGKLSNHYFKWSIYQTVHWKSLYKMNDKVIRIHGLDDHTFPSKLVLNQNTKFFKGGHLVLLDKSKEIVEIIENEIAVKHS